MIESLDRKNLLTITKIQHKKTEIIISTAEKPFTESAQLLR